MSAMGEALKAIRSVLLLQEEVRHLSEAVRAQGDRVTRIAENLVEVDKRVVRIETMIEMSGRSAGPRIEG